MDSLELEQALEEARAGLKAAERAFSRLAAQVAKMVGTDRERVRSGLRPIFDQPLPYLSCLEPAAELVEAVRLATVDFDLFNPARRDELEAYVREQRRIIKALRVAASGRSFGAKARRHQAVKFLLDQADRVIRGEVTPPTAGWTGAPTGSLTREQLAAIAVSRVFKTLREAPLHELTKDQRRKLLVAVAEKKNAAKKSPSVSEWVFLEVACAHGFSRPKAHELAKPHKRRRGRSP